MEEYENISKNVDSAIVKWLEKAPLFGNLQLKSRMILESPRAYLEKEDLSDFLNGIRNEYVSTVSEYLSEESPPPELELKLELLETKLIDDTMNYLLFLIDKSPALKKIKEHAEESEHVLENYGIKTVSDIMQKPESTWKCLDWLLQEKTYGVSVPPESLGTYYSKFHEAKIDYDRLVNWKNLKSRYYADNSEFYPKFDYSKGVPSKGNIAKNMQAHWMNILEGAKGRGLVTAADFMRKK